MHGPYKPEARASESLLALDGFRGGASSFAISAARGPCFGWPRLLATGVAQRREVATQPLSPAPLAAAPSRLRATAATRKRVVDLRGGFLARGAGTPILGHHPGIHQERLLLSLRPLNRSSTE